MNDASNQPTPLGPDELDAVSGGEWVDFQGTKMWKTESGAMRDYKNNGNGTYTRYNPATGQFDVKPFQRGR